MKRLLLLLLVLTMNCRVLIPREHRESTATWKDNTVLVEALTRYKARLSWNPLSQEVIVGPATTEILVYALKPASLVLTEPTSRAKSPGRILPSGLVVSGTTVYYLVEDGDLRRLYALDLDGGTPRSLLSGNILAISSSQRLLVVFGLLSDQTVVWTVPLDEKGRPLAELDGSYEVPGSKSTPLFRLMHDKLYVRSGGSVYLYDADGAKGKAGRFPACFYPIDIDRGLSPDGRLFRRSAEGEPTLQQAEPFSPGMRMTNRLGDERGC